MQKLIKIESSFIGAEEVNSVNARDIHTYLEVKTRFNDWIQRAIKKYDFEENLDYSKMSINVQGVKKPIIEYIVTLDMAKELSMLENNKKGKETRKYFIQMEKEAIAKLQTPSDTNEVMLELLKTQQQFMEVQIKQTDAILELAQSMKQIPQVAPQPQQTQYLDSRDRKKLRDAIQEKAKEVSKDLGVSVATISPSIWIQLKSFFDVDDYQDIHKSQMKDVMHYVMFWEPAKGRFAQKKPEFELVMGEDGLFKTRCLG